MYTTALFFAASALVSNVLAAPTKREIVASALDITNLRLSFRPSNQSSLTFDLADRSPTANETVSCQASFNGASGLGAGVNCNNDKTYYGGSIDRWDSFDNFMLHLQHTYREPAVGQPDVLTVFANTNSNINSTTFVCIPCEEAEVPTTNCAQPSGTKIAAPISSMIA